MRSKTFVQTFWVWKKTFNYIFWVQSKTFVQPLWAQCKTLFKHFGCEASILYKHVGCEARLFTNMWGAKQDFCSNILWAKQDFFGQSPTKGSTGQRPVRKKSPTMWTTHLFPVNQYQIYRFPCIPFHYKLDKRSLALPANPAWTVYDSLWYTYPRIVRPTIPAGNIRSNIFGARLLFKHGHR